MSHHEQKEMKMKKMSMMIMVIGLMAFGAFAGNLQDASGSTAAITTNSQSVTLGSVGEIKLITIDVLNANPVSLTIKDQATGAVVYQNAALAADVTLIPRLATTTAAGAAITFSAGADGTNLVSNTVYAPVNCMGLVVTAVASSNTVNTATVKALTNKNP